MNNVNIILLTAIFLLCAACVYNVDDRDTKNNLTWEILLQKKHCGIYESKNMVIKSQHEFDALWEESQQGIDFGPVKPKVDFSRKWVIACFLGIVNTGGHSIDIQSIEAGPEMTLITIIHKRPGPGCPTAQVIEFPYLMATLDHFTPEKVEFKIFREDVPCK